MISKKILKIISILLAVTFIFTLSACEKKGTDKVETTTTKSEDTNVDYAWEKYASPVTITLGLRTESAVIHDNPDDNWDNNVFTREIEKRFNIKVKNLWTADNAQYSTKLNVSIASGDLPDIYSPDNTQFMQVAKSDLLADLTDVFEKYASSEVKRHMYSDMEGFDSGKFNGKLVGLSSQHWGRIGLPDVIWIREDWMKKFNLSAPKTITEFINICETFSTKDPDGNDKDDTHGLAVIKDLIDTSSVVGFSALTGFFNAYHAYPGIWFKDKSGKIVYGSIQPEMKNALVVLQDMYRKGIIDPEFALKDMPKVVEDFVSGKVGVEIGQNWNGYYPGPDIIKKNGPEAIIMPYAIPSSDDKPVKLGVGWPVSMYYVVNKNCKNPEAAIKIANLDAEIYHTKDPDIYAKFIGGNRNWCCPVAIADPELSATEVEQISYAMETKDTSKLEGDPQAKYLGCVDWVDNKNPDKVGYWLQVGPVGSFAVLMPFFDSGNTVPTEYRGVDTPSMVKNKATLEKLVVETITKIIMGSPLDDFDKMVEDWGKLGGADITKEMNDTYNK